MPEEILPKTQSIDPYPPAPQDPTPAQPLPRHMPKKLAIIILAIIAILFLSSAAFGIYNLGKKSYTPTPTPIATNSPSPTPDPAADWKTYNNIEGKYSFEYPSNFDIHINQSHIFETNDYAAAKNHIELDSPTEDATPFIMIDHLNINSQSLTQFINLHNTQCSDPNSKIGSPVSVGEISGEIFPSCGVTETNIAYFVNNGMGYMVTFQGTVQEDFIKQFLNTFKFNNQISTATNTSPTPKPLTWVSYTSPYLPFTLKYPSDYLTNGFKSIDPNALTARLTSAASETNSNIDDYVMSKYTGNGIDSFDDADNTGLGSLLPKSDFIPNNKYRYRGIRFSQYYLGDKDISTLAPYFRNNKGFSVVKINGVDVGLFDGTTKTTGSPPAYVKTYYFKMGKYILSVGTFIFASSTSTEQNQIFTLLDNVAKTINITQ